MHILYTALETAACVVVVFGPPVRRIGRDVRELRDLQRGVRWLMQLHNYPGPVPRHGHPAEIRSTRRNDSA